MRTTYENSQQAHFEFLNGLILDNLTPFMRPLRPATFIFPLITFYILIDFLENCMCIPDACLEVYLWHIC